MVSIRFFSEEDSHQLRAFMQPTDFKKLVEFPITGRDYIIAEDEGSIVGVISIAPESFYQENSMGLGCIEVSTKYKNRGLARLMLERLYDRCEELGKDLAVTSYEPEGQLKLPRLINEIFRERGIKVLERT